MLNNYKSLLKILLHPIIVFITLTITAIASINVVNVSYASSATAINHQDTEQIKAKLQKELSSLLTEISTIKNRKDQITWIKSKLSDISDLEYTSYYVLGRNARNLTP